MILSKISSLKESKFIKDNLFTLSSFIIVGISGLILQTFITNEYGIDKLGVYAQVISFYNVFACICLSGVATSTLKHGSEYSTNPIELKKIYTSSLILVFIWSILIISGLYVSVRYFESYYSSKFVSEGLICVLPGILLFALNKNSNSFLSGLRDMKVYSLVKIIRWVSLMLLTVGISFLNLEFNYSLICYSVVELLIFVFFLIYNSKYLTLFDLKFKWFKIHFYYGAVSMVSVLMDAVRSNLMILISGYFLTLEETGIFSIFMMFTSVLLLLTNSIQVNFNPVFAKEWANNEIESLKSKMKSVFKITKYTSPLMFAASVVGYYIYSRLFLEYSTENTIMFAIMSIGSIVVFAITWTAPIIALAGELVAEMKKNIITCIIQLIFPIILLPDWGLLGGVLSYMLVQIISTVVTLFYIKKYLNLNIYKLFAESKFNLK